MKTKKQLEKELRLVKTALSSLLAANKIHDPFCLGTTQNPRFDTEFQTRRDSGELRYFNTFEEALKDADVDREVWKISFGLPTGERVRLVKRDIYGTWAYVLEQMPTIQKLKSKLT